MCESYLNADQEPRRARRVDYSAMARGNLLRPLDARNLRILCMVFMTVQIMSGTQKLSQNNTPEPFNRVLEAFFDP